MSQDQPSEHQEQRSRTILIVDDVKMMRTVLRHVLEQGGYNVVEAQNGADALLELKQHPVDLVISDIVMPDMNGLKLVEQIRSLPSSANIPILMCTARGDRDTVLESAQLNVHGYIVKPVDEHMLLEKVRTIFANAVGVRAETSTHSPKEQPVEKQDG
ncbi:MAG: response regulator [Candidatus Hydrogenedentes bacterium]|nr:response regulator [Candidatus Hydrogenedentota bacterium]